MVGLVFSGAVPMDWISSPLFELSERHSAGIDSNSKCRAKGFATSFLSAYASVEPASKRSRRL